MKRQVDLEEISDGRLYSANDLVKADCGGCAGCSACCRGMGESIVLDPLDVHRISIGLKKDFRTLLEKEFELHVVDGIILPSIKMIGEDECCAFLDEEGRCRIHLLRPGICRLFPLGRYYEDGTFRYFLQVHECIKGNRAKIKVKKWIDTPDLKAYEKFVLDWHCFLEELDENLSAGGDYEKRRESCMYVLKNFYLQPYERKQNFYPLFDERLKQAREDLGLSGDSVKEEVKD